MRRFTVTGMSCAACSARVEKAVTGVDGVLSCSVNLLTNSMVVEGGADDNKIIDAVIAAGYGAAADTADTSQPYKSKNIKNDGTDASKEETKALIKRLSISGGFLVLLMYVSMGHVMWGAPMPQFFSGNPIATAIVELLLCVAVMIINKRFFISGIRAVMHRAPNMDTLVALGSGASFVYSVYVLFLMTDAQAKWGTQAASHYLHELYFESAAMILALITVGKLLEAISKGRTTKSLRSLMDLSPKTATVLIDGRETEIPVEKVSLGDIFIVRPGQSVAVDGTIIEGSSSIDESALTGESLPVDKVSGDAVSAGTINRSGFIKCRAERVGEDTTLSQIIKIVSDATATKAPIAKAADKVSGVFVPIVLVIALLAGGVWAVLGKDVGFCLSRAISVLVISCPCALGLATPVAIMVGSGVGAKRGILFKSAKALEATGKADVVVLDKTGTVTLGEMTVTDVLPSDDFDKDFLLSIACSAEKMSEHPLGVAIAEFGEKISANILPIEDFQAVSGRGITGLYNGKRILGGNLPYVQQACKINDADIALAEKLANDGKTPMFFVFDGQFVGIIAVADVIRAESAEAISSLKDMGIRVIMLTGDNHRTATAIGKVAGVDEVISEVLPEGKAEQIKSLQNGGNRVIMVGDGINDAPALATADTGIAIGAGTDVAIDTADVVLVKSGLKDLPAAVKLSRKVLGNIHQNLFWAFCYNAIGIPLAAGVWIPLFGWELSPMFGAAAMSLSSFCVVTNALRLNLVNLDKIGRDRRRLKTKTKNNKKKEKENMTKTLIVEGMMCPHCSGRVKKALEAIDGVETADVSHESGKAVVTLTKAVEDGSLKDAIEAQGYTVLGIE